MGLKQEDDDAGPAADGVLLSGRGKRTRKPSTRAVETEDCGSEEAGLTAQPNSTLAAKQTSPSEPPKTRGRGRQRANPGAPETAQQRAHRRFYERKKEMLSSLEAIAAAKESEYAALCAENAVLKRKHDALAATVAGRDDLLGVLAEIDDLSLQEHAQQQQLQQQEQDGLLVSLLQRRSPEEQPSDESQLDGSGSGSEAADNGTAALQPAEQQGFGTQASASMGEASAGGADSCMADLMSGFMHGLEAAGGSAACAALQASFAQDRQDSDTAQQQQHHHERQLHANTSFSSRASTSTHNPAGSSSSSSLGSRPRSSSPSGGPFSLQGMVSWYSGAIKRMAAQLARVDEGAGPAAQQELERMVIDVRDRLRKQAIVDRVTHAKLKLINMETGEPDTPPRGHWEYVSDNVPLDETTLTQLLACHEVYSDHVARVLQERRRLAAELQGAIASLPQGEGALGFTTQRKQQQQQQQGQQEAELQWLDGILLGQQWQQQQQQQHGAMSEAEAALALMADVWQDRQQQGMEGGLFGAEELGGSYRAASWGPTASHMGLRQPGMAAAGPAGVGSSDTCLLAANMQLLSRINDNLAKEDSANHMLAYALNYVLSLTHVARSLVLSWPFFPDTQEVTAITVAKAKRAAAAAAPAAAQPAAALRTTAAAF